MFRFGFWFFWGGRAAPFFTRIFHVCWQVITRSRLPNTIILWQFGRDKFISNEMGAIGNHKNRFVSAYLMNAMITFTQIIMHSNYRPSHARNESHITMELNKCKWNEINNSISSCTRNSAHSCPRLNRSYHRQMCWNDSLMTKERRENFCGLPTATANMF